MKEHSQKGVSPSLLIVDDLPAIHEMIKSIISPSGYLCAGATTGEEALLRFQQSRFDVCLIDYSMTPMDGISLTYELLSKAPDVVVLLMSGFVDDEVREAAKKAGVFAVVEKPFQFDQLRHVIKSAVDCAHRHSARSENPNPQVWPTLSVYLEERKRAYIKTVMKAVDGDNHKAAKILGIPVDEIEQ